MALLLLGRIGIVWDPGEVELGMDWPGMDWPGMDWPGMDWPGMDWPDPMEPDDPIEPEPIEPDPMEPEGVWPVEDPGRVGWDCVCWATDGIAPNANTPAAMMRAVFMMRASFEHPGLVNPQKRR